MARGILSGVLLAALAFPAAAQLNAKRRELAKVQNELKQTLMELEELREAERGLDDDVKGLANRDEQSRRRVEALQSDIRRAEARRADLKSRLDAARSVSGFWTAALASEAARHSSAGAARSDVYGSRELWGEEFRRAAIIEKARHLKGLHGFRRKTEEAAAETGRRARDLDENRRRAQSEREARRREYEEKKAALEETQVKVAAAARRAKELEESAKAMTALLEKLGKQGRRRTSSSAKLDRPAHSLPWPVEGRVARPFGRERDPQLGTWTVRQGVQFACAPGAPVTAIAPGSVIFAGPFRSYGKVVIVEHGGGFFSVYGELGDIAKDKGAVLRAGERLASAGPEGRAYLEIRRGAEALDPADWLERK